MDDEPSSPFDSGASQVAAAQAQLEVARRTGGVGAIALAQMNLAATLARVGDLPAAETELTAVIADLGLAQHDEEAETRRWLRMSSPAAPPPTAGEVDPVQLQALARIHLAEILLVQGRRADASAALDLAAPACRGLGKGRLRKHLNAVRRRLDEAAQVPAAGSSRERGPGLPEQVAAADELLGGGEFADAARLALSVIDACGDDDVRTRARARQVLGMSLEGLQRPEDAAQVLTDSFNDYLAADQPVAAAQITVPLAWRLSELGRTADAAALIERALAVSEGSALPGLRAQLMTDLASVLDRQGDRAGARRTFEAAVLVAESVSDRELAANARHGLAVVLAAGDTSDREDEVEALTLLDNCRDVYDALSLPDRAAGCEHEAAALLGRLGSLDAAAARYQKALERYDELPPAQRDTGSWPDEVADIRANLTALRAGSHDSPDLFRSGGHAMDHG